MSKFKFNLKPNKDGSLTIDVDEFFTDLINATVKEVLLQLNTQLNASKKEGE